MGYFSNGTEGMDYQAHWCVRCRHHDKEEGCAVWDAHLLYNYDQNKDAGLAQVLDTLIPRDSRGSNGQCQMFLAKPKR